MRYTRVRNVKEPNRANKGDAGMDLFIPPITDRFILDLTRKNEGSRWHILWEKTGYDLGEDNFERVIILPPGERLLIPSGIHVELPKNHKLEAANKSGVASKMGLDKMAELVDESYQGELHISLANTSNDIVILRSNMKIIQFVLSEYNPTPWEEVPCLTEMYKETTSRGQGGFGSTGN